MLHNKTIMKQQNFFILIIIITLSSCVTLSKGTVEMSSLLGKQIDVLQENHLKILNLYFNDKRQKSVDYLDNKWYPAFINELYKQEYVSTIWQEAINAKDINKRTEVLKAITLISLEEYNKQRKLLIDPIDECQSEMLTLVKEEYQKAKRMNLAVTQNISLVQQIQEKQNKYLSGIVNTEKIDQQMEQSVARVDSAFSRIQSLIEKCSTSKNELNNIIINTIK